MKHTLTARFDNEGPYWLFALAALFFLAYAVYSPFSDKENALSDILPGVFFSLASGIGFLLTRPTEILISADSTHITTQRQLICGWSLKLQVPYTPDSQVCIGKGGGRQVNLGSYLSSDGGHVFLINGAKRTKIFTNTRSGEECQKVAEFLRNIINAGL